jgi:hypothetical protein
MMVHGRIPLSGNRAKAIMDEDERKALVADITHHRELLSGTLDPGKLAGLEFLIRRLEGKLTAAGFPLPPETPRRMT